MGRKRSDRGIISEVFHEYVWSVPYVRRLLVPTLLVMVMSKFLEVKVADLYKDISRAIKSGSGQEAVLVTYAITYGLSVLLGELQSLIICRAGQIGYRLANREAYNHFIRLHPSNFQKLGKGEIQNTIGRKAQAVQDIIDVFTLNFFPTFLTVLFISYKVVSHIGIVAMMMINVAIVAYAVATIRITRWRNTMRVNINAATNASSNIQIDGLLNHETIYVYNTQGYEVLKYDAALRNAETHTTSLESSKYILNFVQKGIWCLLSITIITTATLGLMVERMNTEELAFFIGVIAILIKSLDNFGFMYGKYQQALINMKLVTLSGEGRGEEGCREIYKFTSRISFRGLTLRSNDKILVENACFDVNRGEKVAIVGKNGVGKSSLLKALLKIRPVRTGGIFIDDVNIDEISDDSFKSIVSYVSQDPRLFNNTVMYNIGYGSPKSLDEDVYRLSRELGLHRGIGALENGYHTQVGEQGTALSGGERQKIIVLRALIRGSPVLVMDEPTASLDKRAEEKILGQLMKYDDLTVIMIVHNLDILGIFDRILLVERSGVREIKNISELDMDSWAATGQ